MGWEEAGGRPGREGRQVRRRRIDPVLQQKLTPRCQAVICPSFQKELFLALVSERGGQKRVSDYQQGNLRSS